jgi:hypothetical protein
VSALLEFAQTTHKAAAELGKPDRRARGLCGAGGEMAR